MVEYSCWTVEEGRSVVEGHSGMHSELGEQEILTLTKQNVSENILLLFLKLRYSFPLRFIWTGISFNYLGENKMSYLHNVWVKYVNKDFLLHCSALNI